MSIDRAADGVKESGGVGPYIIIGHRERAGGLITMVSRITILRRFDAAIVEHSNHLDVVVGIGKMHHVYISTD